MYKSNFVSNIVMVAYSINLMSLKWKQMHAHTSYCNANTTVMLKLNVRILLSFLKLLS